MDTWSFFIIFFGISFRKINYFMHNRMILYIEWIIYVFDSFHFTFFIFFMHDHVIILSIDYRD